jgi:hypothetical protein
MELLPIRNVKSLRFQAGDVCGDLTIVKPLGSKHFGKGVAVVYECRCKCGALVQRDRQTLIRSAKSSCGCDTVGTSPDGAWHHPLYKTWRHMIDRCNNPANKSYPDYGGRGIKVCNRWIEGEGGRTGLECFALDMGNRPRRDLTLERSNTDGHYSPENCSWANRVIQARNRRVVHMITFRGRTQARSAWAQEMGIPYFTLVARLKNGWNIERALTEPVRAY